MIKGRPWFLTMHERHQPKAKWCWRWYKWTRRELKNINFMTKHNSYCYRRCSTYPRLGAHTQHKSLRAGLGGAETHRTKKLAPLNNWKCAALSLIYLLLLHMVAFFFCKNRRKRLSAFGFRNQTQQIYMIKQVALKNFRSNNNYNNNNWHIRELYMDGERVLLASRIASHKLRHHRMEKSLKKSNHSRRKPSKQTHISLYFARCKIKGKMCLFDAHIL